jgi:hypothetical protein
MRLTIFFSVHFSADRQQVFVYKRLMQPLFIIFSDPFLYSPYPAMHLLPRIENEQQSCV